MRLIAHDILTQHILTRQYSQRLNMGAALYHGYAAWPYRQGSSVARDGCELQLWHMGMARRASLLGVAMRPGRAVECFGTPRAGIEPGGGVGVCT